MYIAAPKKLNPRLPDGTRGLRIRPSQYSVPRPCGRSPVAPPIRAKLAIGHSGDVYEREADRVADQVMRVPLADFAGSDIAPTPIRFPAIRRLGRRREKALLQAKREDGVKEGAFAIEPYIRGLYARGEPLAPAARAFMEPRFGVDFGAVRIHNDAEADRSARLINALAYTADSHIVFRAGHYDPASREGKHLLAHELAHVLQQRSHVDIQRQEIPPELQVNVDLTALSEEELHQRHDLIVSTLSQFDQSTWETGTLEEEAGNIGRELARREALAAGRTFAASDIERMKQYFIKNTKRARPRNCIDTMNDGIQALYGDKKQKVRDSVDRTMGALQEAGRAGEPRVIEFEDRKGRVSKSGALYPYKPHESVWDAIMQMAGGDVGWSVFGMGPADMSHSVTLTLDNSDPLNSAIYWSDQWTEKAGWKKFDKPGLDAEVARITQIIWEKKDDRHKPHTRVTLWRLRREVKNPAAP